MPRTASRPILLVEDNPDDVDLTLRALSGNRITNPVIVARDGLEALAYLLGDAPSGADPSHAAPAATLAALQEDTDKAALLPAVILLDLKLPCLDGLEVLHRLRQHPRTAYIPVVMLSTSVEPRDLHESYRLGANSYIRKPVDFQSFMQVIGQIALYWLVHNQPAPHPAS